MKLRPYQQEATQEVLKDMEKSGNAVVCMAQGSGKSLVIAEVANQLKSKVLVLCPNKEILEQNYEKMLLYVKPIEVGIYSASAKRRDVALITFATLGTAKSAPELFTGTKLLIIDEAHQGIDPAKVSSIFFDFYKAIGSPKVIGFTATPYRLQTFNDYKNGEAVTAVKVLTRIKGKRKEMFWARILTNITTRELTEAGYLHRPLYHDNSQIQHEQIPVLKSESDFDLVAFEEMILPTETSIMSTVSDLQAIHRSVVVFCVSIEQATRMSLVTKDSSVVSGETPLKERTQIIKDFKSGVIKTVFNVQCLTTGFDMPELDALVLVRPTRSPSLYLQMIGRIMRQHPDKDVARVVDFSGTLKALGRAEDVELYKVPSRYEGAGWDIKTKKRSRLHGVPLYRFSKNNK